MTIALLKARRIEYEFSAVSKARRDNGLCGLNGDSGQHNCAACFLLGMVSLLLFCLDNGGGIEYIIFQSAKNYAELKANNGDLEDDHGEHAL